MQFSSKPHHPLSWSRARRLNRWFLFLAIGLSLCLGLFSPWIHGSTALAQSPTVAAVEAQPQPTTSPSVKDLKKWQKNLKEHRSGVSKQRQQWQQMEKVARDRLEQIQSHVAATSAQIQQAEANLAEAAAALEQLQKDFEANDQKYRQSLESAGARLRFLQRRRHQSVWAMLLASDTVGQFLERRQQLQQVYEADQKLLTKLKSESDRLKAQQQQIQFQQQQISQLREALLVQKSAYESQAIKQQTLVNRLTFDRGSLEQAETQLQRDAENITALLQQRLSYAPTPPGVDRVFIYGSGRLSFPISAPITSHFGWRMHPALGYRRFHAGTDFGANIGTPIRAADQGRVVFSGWYGGYGNTVIIDHGRGLSTLYAHANELYVREGQRVQKGEAIASVGSTGLSTGPHLHFEVRVNGEPQNPLAYL